MKSVLDVSTALCWVLPRPDSPKALRLRDECRRQVRELIAPAHFPLEVASGLTKAERQKLIAVGDAAPLIQNILNTPPVLHPIDPLFYRAVDISSQTRSSFVDCLYMARAERGGCELITADAKLISNLQGRFPF